MVTCRGCSARRRDRDVEDLRIPPGNRLERIASDRRGQLRRAVRGKAARFHDPVQIGAWAQGGEIELANAIFVYIEVFYNRRRRHCCLEYATPHDYDLAGIPRALTTTGS